jgi:hypothetical protein
MTRWKAARAGGARRWAGLHLEMKVGVLRLENAHRMRLAAAVVHSEGEQSGTPAPQGATLFDAIIARNTNSHVSV